MILVKRRSRHPSALLEQRKERLADETFQSSRHPSRLPGSSSNEHQLQVLSDARSPVALQLLGCASAAQRAASVSRLVLMRFFGSCNRQLGDVGGDAPGLVAGEEVRRLPVGVADDEAPPIQLGVGLLDGPGGGSGGTSAPNPNQHASCAKQPRSSRQQGSHGVLSLAIGDIRRKLS